MQYDLILDGEPGDYLLTPVKDGRYERMVALFVVALPSLATVLGVYELFAHGLPDSFGLSPILPRAFAWPEAFVLCFFYIATMIGIETGFHRLFSHNAFQARPGLRYVLAVLGSMAAQGPPIFWAAMHRRHHAGSDGRNDPHSPHAFRDGRVAGKIRGLFHAHVGWLFVPDNTDWLEYATDLARDRAFFTIHRLYFVWLTLGLCLPALLVGLWTMSWSGAVNGLLWGGFVRIFLVHQAIWAVNSLCHSFGTREFNTNDKSTNNVWLLPATLGASWHNNHHAFAGSARVGFRWYQVDLHYLLIRGLRSLGLVERIQEPGEKALQARRIK